jgi:CRISPR/Cas system-associated exonuclease Cas4 (RecB family)
MSSPFDLDKIYVDFIDKKNEENYQERYVGNEGWYKASSAGFCSRKMYYESVMKLEPTNPPNDKSKMVMRLGTVFHDELQGALKSLKPSDTYIYNTSIDNTSIDNINIYKEKNRNTIQKESKIHVEGNIEIPDLNVRGHYDIVFEGDKVYLYDIKTIGAWSWRTKFGRDKKPDYNRSYPLQLGTYAIGIEDKFGRIDGMYLYYYNKDNSNTKTVEVPLVWKSKAYMYWEGINREHKKGLPQLELGQSPEEAWACNYCGFKDICKPEEFLKENKNKGVWK